MTEPAITDGPVADTKAGRPRVGVTVISGFLGSGKTTLMRRLVADPLFGPRLAVLVNDVGQLGLDPDLVRDAVGTPTLRVTELVSGCICCSLQGEFVTALRALLRGEGLPRRPEYILIEPSGIARASELSFAINAIGNDEPVQTDAVITVVDAWNAQRAYDEQPDVFCDQLRSADLVLINKRDLVPSVQRRAELEAWLREHAPRATMLWTEQAAIDPHLLFGQIDLLARDAAPPHATPPNQRSHGGPHPHHEAATTQDGFGAVTLPVPFVLNRGRLEDFLDAQADHIFRIKGVVDVQFDDGQRPALVQAVGDRVDIDALPATSPLQQAPRRLIFISQPRQLDSSALSAGLADARHRPEDN